MTAIMTAAEPLRRAHDLHSCATSLRRCKVVRSATVSSVASTVTVAKYRQNHSVESGCREEHARHSVNGAVFSMRPKPGQDTAQGKRGLRGVPCLSIFAWFWRFTPS
jgi:hypothetical protein